ncbi:DUF3656 domain-containing U32 family peptidase [Floccifex sp.]|uniref:U32 family peptidase n=1 Tax=Floccifex sp. TaxID=2815810 RepID=UPI003F059511
MTELLAPAGNMEALKAAIANGCNAIYLGMQRFGARAYSSNFDYESLKEAVNYAHIRNVKIYVTMNTIVFEDEIEDMEKQLQILNEAGVDGIIVQDMAVFDAIVSKYPDMEAHCSTQMGIDDLEGTLLWKELGAKRVVLSREVDIQTVKDIRKKADIPIEVFVHGALCVSYSGNCLMSGLIGYRSGNRGRCVGSCRKLYEIIDTTNQISLGKNYILSMKDLNTIDYIEDLKEIDSLKIEGRMKEPVYVANVVSKYRKALDGNLKPQDKEDLLKTFNRTYTKGYMFKEDKKNITNIVRPNNYGYEIGKISNINKGKYEILLSKTLNQNDMIRIDHNNEDINLCVTKLYDEKDKLINQATKKAYIKLKEKLSIGDVVYKTKDILYYKELEKQLEGEYQRFDLDIQVYAYPQCPLIIEAKGLGVNYTYESEIILECAKNNPTTKEQIIKQFSRLKDTVFTLHNVEFESYDIFIPVKELNQARREIVQGLYTNKINEKPRRVVKPEQKKKISFEQNQPILCASVLNQEQYDACVQAGIETIYFDNIIRRNQNHFQPRQGTLLIGGYGGIHYYRDTNEFVSDYSLNVVNAQSVYQLHALGAKRVTLSYEINEKQLKELIEAYNKQNDGYPSLEMIVYGRAPLMFTNYCPLKKMNQCGTCHLKSYELKDEHGTFPILSHEDCTTTILNGKILNLLDEMPSISHVQAFRLNFTTESKEEILQIVNIAKDKLNHTNMSTVFDQNKDTRGHFNKEIA